MSTTVATADRFTEFSYKHLPGSNPLLLALQTPNASIVLSRMCPPNLWMFFITEFDWIFIRFGDCLLTHY